MVLSLSQEKGIRLHFAATSSYDFRVNYLEMFLNYCSAYKMYVDPKDDDIGLSKWWEALKSASLTTEQTKPLTAVGMIKK